MNLLFIIFSFFIRLSDVNILEIVRGEIVFPFDFVPNLVETSVDVCAAVGPRGFPRRPKYNLVVIPYDCDPWSSSSIFGLCVAFQEPRF